MKDAYSFDTDAAGLDRSFNAMRAAYERIYARRGLQALAAQVFSGAMGGWIKGCTKPSPRGTSRRRGAVERTNCQIVLLADGGRHAPEVSWLVRRGPDQVRKVRRGSRPRARRLARRQ